MGGEGGWWSIGGMEGWGDGRGKGRWWKLGIALRLALSTRISAMEEREVAVARSPNGSDLAALSGRAIKGKNCA